MGILLYGVTVMRAVIQEKSNRVVELLVACARPWDLLIGKVIGVGAVGLTQLSVWVGTALVLARFRGPLLAQVGIEGAGSVALPSVGVGEVAITLVYFLGGYALYAAMYAAIGAACSSEREAQQAQIPVMIPMVAAFASFPAITAAPNSALSVALTLVPFFSPVLMPMRYMLAPLPSWQLVASIALLLATTLGTVWAASRIYRTGILMYGKKASLGEIVKWLRET
jgi:ABC-2 type transport system permease protein